MDTKELKYVVGLDIGITSVGWATLLLDSQDEPVRILDLNSRILIRRKYLRREPL